MEDDGQTDRVGSRKMLGIKHGIKMTGVPALGPTHDDQTLLNITAFVRELPAMTPESYASLGNGGQQQGSHQNDAPNDSTH